MEFEDGEPQYVPRLPGEEITAWLERMAIKNGFMAPTKKAPLARLPYREPGEDDE
jgi:hypothetical protein